MTALLDHAPIPRQISYSIKSGSVATGLGESSLRQAIRKGLLAARYYRSTVLIDAEDLARYVRALDPDGHDRAFPDQAPQQISYNLRQAAAATGLGESTLREIIRKAILPARHHGATPLIPADALAAFYRSLPSERQVDRSDVAANRKVA